MPVAVPMFVVSWLMGVGKPLQVADWPTGSANGPQMYPSRSSVMYTFTSGVSPVLVTMNWYTTRPPGAGM